MSFFCFVFVCLFFVVDFVCFAFTKQMGFLCHLLLNLFTISPNCYDLWVIHSLHGYVLKKKKRTVLYFVLSFFFLSL